MPVLSDSQIASLAKAAGFPADQIATAVAVSLGESGGRSDAFNGANTNGSWDAGLWQINSIHGYSKEHLFNPANNAAAAFRVWSQAGKSWRPWVVYNTGRHLPYMARGKAAAVATNGGKVIVPGSPPPPNGGRFGIVGSNDGFLEIITDPTTWMRLGLFLLGFILVLWGAYQMTGIGSVAIRTLKGVAVAKGL